MQNTNARGNAADQKRAAEDAGITSTLQNTGVIQYVASLSDEELIEAQDWPRSRAFQVAVRMEIRSRGLQQ